ncbi:restriction endonuclease subunit S [Lonsdalea quercina]|uniref:restriction endonuclease subunit S n=1 Tax=Lonsdalea quercina TaxID=71657 RepID=UPI0039762985
MNKYTVELLEKHFDTAFAAPDGIKKLRELILTLAMQGRLVPQDPSDQPASELLKEIEAEKQRMVKEGKIRKPKPLPPVTEGEKPYALPQGWEWVRLGTVVLTVTGGGTPSKNNPNFWGGKIPWASVKDLNVETYLETTIDSITEDAVAASSTNVIPKDQVIVCTRMGLGKIAINRTEVAINQDLKALDLSNQIDQMFFFKKYKNYSLVGSGMTVKGIRQDDLLNLPFPLPPLEEQHRIVAKIDELMARCDELEKLRVAQQEKRLTVHAAAIRQLLNITEPDQHRHAQAFLAKHFGELYTVKENVAELRKAILQLAVMGKLVPQNPDDQPASELLKEIEAEKQRLVKAGKIKKPKPLPPITEEEKPYVLPQEWEWVRLGDLTQIITKGSSPNWQGVQYVDKNEGILFITSENVRAFELLLEKRKYVERKFNEIEPRSILKKYDILMNIVGASIGRTAIFDLDELANINQAVTIIRLIEKLDHKYFLKFFNSPICLSYMLNKQVDNARPNLSMGNISLFAIPLPPLQEQHRIVEKIDNTMALCDSLDQQIDAAISKQAKLLNALMHAQLQSNTEEENQPALLSKDQVIDLTTYRTSIGCYAINKLANAQYFGRTAAAKVMYLAQAHIGLGLDLKPEREAAGPLDKWIYEFEQQGQGKGWFKVNEKLLASGRKKTEYRCLSALSEPSAKAEKLMSSEQKAEFDRLIYALADKKTEEVEIIATLFAVWNDFLIDGTQPTDEQIIRDMRENWHERKARFSPSDLKPWLSWLRKEDFIPRGLPPRTTQLQRLGV